MAIDFCEPCACVRGNMGDQEFYQQNILVLCEILAALTSGSADTNVNVAEWGGTATSLGQKAMAASVPVVIASDQSSLPINIDNDIPLSNATTLTGFAVGNVGWAHVALDVIEAASTSTVLNLTAHVALPGDIIRFPSVSQTGTTSRQWSVVQSVTANTVTLSYALGFTPSAGQDIAIARPTPISASQNSGTGYTGLGVTLDTNYQTSAVTGLLKAFGSSSFSALDAVVGMGVIREDTPSSNGTSLLWSVLKNNDYQALYTDGVRRRPYAHTQPTVTNATSFTLLAASNARRYILIQNNSAANIMINLNNGTLTGIVPTSTNVGIVLAPGAAYETPPNACPVSAVTCYQTSGGSINTISVTEQGA